MPIAPLWNGPSESFRITHPFHPLRGRQFELVSFRQNWGEERVYFHDENHDLRSIPARWTSAVEPDPFVVVAAGRALFRLEDILRLACLVAECQGKEGGE